MEVHSPRHAALSARIQSLLGSPHLGVLHALSAQLGACQGTHQVSLGDDRISAVVLSDVTEAHDRGDGSRAARQQTSLQEHLLFSPRRPQIDRYWRHPQGWMFQSYEAGETVTLSTGHVLSVDALYDGILELEGDAPLTKTLTEVSERLLALAAWLRERPE